MLTEVDDDDTVLIKIKTENAGQDNEEQCFVLVGLVGK